MSGYEEIRVYGEIVGISQENAEKLTEEYYFHETQFKDDTLDIVYEGNHFFIQEFIEAAVPLMHADGHGKVDYIDQHEWKLHRYKLANNNTYKLTITSLNDILDHHSRQ